MNYALIIMNYLQPSAFVIAIVGTIGDDNVVKETDAHKVAGSLDAISQVVIHRTGKQIARRMVVTDG